MKNLWFVIGAMALVLGLSLAGSFSVARAETPVTRLDSYHPFWEKISGWGKHAYQGRAELVQAEMVTGYPLGNSDPDTELVSETLLSLPPNIDLVLFGLADSNRYVIFDRRNNSGGIYTRIETTDNNHEVENGGLAKRRAQRINAALNNPCTIAETPLISMVDGERGYVMAFFNRERGSISLMRDWKAPEYATKAALDSAIAAWKKFVPDTTNRDRPWILDWQRDHERRIRALENKPCNIGLYIGAGMLGLAAQGKAHNITSPCVVVGGNFYEVGGEAYFGQHQPDATTMVRVGHDEFPSFSNRDIEGFSLLYGSKQGDQWGKFVRVGGIYLRSESYNIPQYSDWHTEFYGAIAVFSYPVRIIRSGLFLKPELGLTVGQNKTTEAATAYGQHEHIVSGLGYGAHVAVTIAGGR